MSNEVNTLINIVFGLVLTVGTFRWLDPLCLLIQRIHYIKACLLI